MNKNQRGYIIPVIIIFVLLLAGMAFSGFYLLKKMGVKVEKETKTPTQSIEISQSNDSSTVESEIEETDVEEIDTEFSDLEADMKEL